MTKLGEWVKRNGTLLSVIAVLILAGLGFDAVSHMLHEVKLHEVRADLWALKPLHLALAIGLTALSYLALTLYDVLALRAIGRPLPYRTAALASFTSYTLSHNLGLSLLTGGSARYRVYSAAGLGMADVSRVIAIASMTFWGGVLTLAGAMLTLHPEALAIDGIGIGAAPLRIIGIILVVAIVALLAWAGRNGRTLRLFGMSLPIPGTGLALSQIGVAAFDLAVASAALFILVPGLHADAWPAFFVGYTLAIIAVLISHVPGGIGIFEAVMLAALPGIDKSELVAALLVYRIIYYVAPLLIAVGLVTVQEGRRWRQPLVNTLQGVQTVASGLAPVMIAALVFIGGVVLLISGSLPAVPRRTHALLDIVPLPFIEASHMAASLSGAMLLILSSGLYRRLDGAFWLTRILLLAGAAFSLLKGLDYEEAFVMLGIAAALQWTRAAFYRRTQFTADTLSAGWLATVAVALGLSVWIGMFAYKHVAYQNDLWWDFAARGDASRFLRASFAVAILLIALAVWRMMRPAPHHAMMAQAQTAPQAAIALAQRADVNLALIGDKRFLVSESGNCFLMYQIAGHSWIVMGNPVGDRSEWADLLWSLRERADAEQGRLLLYQIDTEALPIAIELGLQIVKYGEEARIDLSAFTMEGPAAKGLRYAERRCEREGATFEIIPLAELPAIMGELANISARWLAAKGGHREKGFSIGKFDPTYMAHFDCAVVRVGDRIVAFANIWRTEGKSELSVDLMRHEDDMPYGAMDFLFIRLMQWGQGQDYRWFNLGLAPLSGLEARRLAPFWVKLGSLLYRHGESLYGFEGLRAYKDKFSPVWQPRYVAGPQGVGMGRALIDLQALIAAK